MLNAEMALVLYGVFLAFAFGYQTILHGRRTGSTGVRGISGRVGSPERLAGVGFVVALLIGVAAPVVAIAGLVDRIDWVDRSWIQIAGIVLFGLGHFAGRLHSPTGERVAD